MSVSSWISFLRSRTVCMTSLPGCLTDTPTSQPNRRPSPCPPSVPPPVLPISHMTPLLSCLTENQHSPHPTTTHPNQSTVKSISSSSKSIWNPPLLFIFISNALVQATIFFCLNYCNSLLTDLTGPIFAPLKFILSEVNYSLLTVLSVPWGRKKSPEWPSHTFIIVSKLDCSLQIPAWPGSATSIYVTILVPTRRLQPQSPLFSEHSHLMASVPTVSTASFPRSASFSSQPSCLSLNITSWHFPECLL